jgi:tetratricopeptide (TPR) repeat protein
MGRFMTVALATLVCVTGLYAQMPQFKSQEAFDAFMLVQGAVTPEQRAGAGVDFIAQFPKSEAVGLASYMVMLSYQQMNDFDNMLLYGEMVLDSNPAAGVKTGTLISLANAIPTRTREYDLDKEEKLNKAEDFAKQAMNLIPTIQKMDPNLSDDEWLATKMDFMSQCHEAIGSVMIKRQDYPAAEVSMRKALEMSPNPTPFTLYQLATALSKQGKNEEAAEMADRCSAGGGVESGGSDFCAQLKRSLAN